MSEPEPLSSAPRPLRPMLSICQSPPETRPQDTYLNERSARKLSNSVTKNRHPSEQDQDSSPDQLPSPELTGSGFDTNRKRLDPSTRKRKARSCTSYHPPTKRIRLHSDSVLTHSPVKQWLADLPKSNEFEQLEDIEVANDMNQPPPKRSRSRSTDSASRQSGNGSDSEAAKYGMYTTPNYAVVLETKGSYMRSSKSGMVKKDRELCDRLLKSDQAIPDDILFQDKHFDAFFAKLRGRSEARICADLHPRVMPSVENLCIAGREKFEGLVEGHNDSWMKAFPFYGPRPQPDHTVGFKWSQFSEQQRRKLGIEPLKKSYYTAREDIYFPFLTGEVKCGKQGLDLADLPNHHSMTVAQRGIVDLYRRAGRADDVHRRVLGFSISHDDRGVRLYAYYPEIDGNKTTYWRDTLREFTFSDNQGKERWTCYKFTLNVCDLFALPLLEQLKNLIDELADPAVESFGLTTPLEDFSVQDDASNVEPRDKSLMEPPQKHHSEAALLEELEQKRKELEQLRQQLKEAPRKD